MRRDSAPARVLPSPLLALEHHSTTGVGAAHTAGAGATQLIAGAGMEHYTTEAGAAHSVGAGLELVRRTLQAPAIRSTPLVPVRHTFQLAGAGAANSKGAGSAQFTAGAGLTYFATGAHAAYTAGTGVMHSTTGAGAAQLTAGTGEKHSSTSTGAAYTAGAGEAWSQQEQD